jgi:hypothetical protein
MKRLLVLSPLILLVIGCLGPSPTVMPTETVDVPTQTPIMIIETQEVPVTQVVEVTRQVEVTRIVERVITATPEPTAIPTVSPTVEPSPTASVTRAPAVKTQLLNSLISLRREIEAMNFDEMVVRCSRGYEDSLPDHYESIIAYPTYDVSNASPTVRAAYANYREAIETIESSNRDLYISCLDWIDKGKPDEYVSSLTAGIARQGINDALGLIIPAIDMLESE